MSKSSFDDSVSPDWKLRSGRYDIVSISLELANQESISPEKDHVQRASTKYVEAELRIDRFLTTEQVGLVMVSQYLKELSTY